MKTTELILQSDVWRRDSGKGFFWLDSLFRCNCCFIRTWKSFLWLNLIKWLRITNLYTQNSRTVLYMKHDFVKFQVCSHMHPWCTHTCTHLTITSSIPAARTTRSLQNVLRSPAKSLFLLLKCCSMLMSRCLNHKKKKCTLKDLGSLVLAGTRLAHIGVRILRVQTCVGHCSLCTVCSRRHH